MVLLQDAPSRDVLEDWVDSQARVRGVYAPVFSSDRQLVGFHLQTPSVEQMDILQPHLGDTFASAPRLIYSLLEYHPEGVPRHRVKVEGRVTYQGMEGSLYVADDSGGIRIEGADSDEGFWAVPSKCWDFSPKTTTSQCWSTRKSNRQ